MGEKYENLERYCRFKNPTSCWPLAKIGKKKKDGLKNKTSPLCDSFLNSTLDNSQSRYQLRQ